MKSGPVRITRMPMAEFNERVARLDEEKRSRLKPAQLDVTRLTKYVSDSVTVRSGEPIPECITCGACCDIFAVVPMAVAESERLGDFIEVTADPELDVVVDRLVKRDFVTGRCANLRGEIGREIGCSVYELRPSVCRAFEAGSDKCHELRRMYGLEPQLTDEEVALFGPVTRARKIGAITNSVCFVDSVSVSMERSEEMPGMYESKRSVNMKIVAAVDGDLENCIELHTYNPDQENWLQSEFIGMTIEEARQRIAARSEQGVSN